MNNLPRPVNPHAAKDIEEGRQLSADAGVWLAELDALLDGTEVPQ